MSYVGDPLKIIILAIYPLYLNHEELTNSLRNRVILAPTLYVVD